MKRKIRQYETAGIIVEFEPARCIHSERCARGLPEVFNAEARPWIQPDRATADAVAAVIEQCPSGALQYRRADGGEEEMANEENTLQIAPNGPLTLTGRIELELPDGETRQETRVTLCRCGASKNKPFCDGSHRDNDFNDSGSVADRPLRPIEQHPSSALMARFSSKVLCRSRGQRVRRWREGREHSVGAATRPRNRFAMARTQGPASAQPEEVVESSA